ncbi:MAG TPA: glucoamylase family protein [Pyrinomonadaceae bacterium]|nr:glucoamylase family protein [Pyrinomonadaceae bacterium]
MRHPSRQRFVSTYLNVRGAFISFLCTVLLLSNCLPAQAQRRARRLPPKAKSSAHLNAADEAFLEDMSRRTFRFFWEQADAQTGLVRDRARTDNSPLDENHQDVASIAATGFGLTALAIAAERGWLTPREAQEGVRATLRFFATRATNVHGWFYHWMDARTGTRRWNSEVSSIDTALLLAGVLTVRQKFRDDAEIVRLSTGIYERVDFPWMLNGHPTLLSHGWRPETGFIKYRWDAYSEHLILYLLAMGSPTHPITPRSWLAWRRERITYAGYTYITGGPLFIHQYSHAWVDFRGRRESHYPFTDYFANSVAATRAHRAFCLALSAEFPGYTENVWGITASDSEKGYLAWGGPPRDAAIDGTVVPCAAGGSLMLAPDIALPALRTIHDKYGTRIYGMYGFADAFNPNNGWVNPDVIGINLGIMLLSAENLRTGNVWRWFMQNPEIPRALQLVGLRRDR